MCTIRPSVIFPNFKQFVQEWGSQLGLLKKKSVRCYVMDYRFLKVAMFRQDKDPILKFIVERGKVENTPNFQHIDEQSNCYERTILRVCQFFTITGGEVLVYSISKDPNQSIILLMNSHLYVMSAA